MSYWGLAYNQAGGSLVPPFFSFAYVGGGVNASMRLNGKMYVRGVNFGYCGSANSPVNNQLLPVKLRRFRELVLVCL